VTLRSALLRLVATAASLAALAVLWRYRPEWPDLPGSLSAPVTTTLLQELAVSASWLLAALLVLLLLARSFSRAQARRLLDPSGVGLSAEARRSTRARPIRSFALRPAGVEARLVVVGPREAAAIAREEDVPRDLPDTKPAERPLISLLGPLTIHGAKQSRRGLRARALELIAFLALRRKGAQRDEILEALWPGEDPKRSRHRLYQAVRDARRLIGDALMSERDRYWLDRSRVRVDVDELEARLDEAGRTDTRSRRHQLRTALGLFRDEPLAGCDFAWCDGDVRRLRGTYVELLEEVGRASLDAGQARAALDAAERGLAVDMLNESLWRLAMEAENALGLREAVADRYERLRALLDERLGLEPARETRHLHRSLLAQT
jgi:DNA-binding SARP family transcriptional activator